MSQPSYITVEQLNAYVCRKKASRDKRLDEAQDKITDPAFQNIRRKCTLEEIERNRLPLVNPAITLVVVLAARILWAAAVVFTVCHTFWEVFS